MVADVSTAGSASGFSSPLSRAMRKRASISIISIAISSIRPLLSNPASNRTRGTERGRVIYDSGVTLAETWQAIERLVDDGHCRSIGLSDISRRLSAEKVRPQLLSLRQPTSAPVGLCGAIALEILLFCRDFHAREFEGLGQAGLKRAWRMDFSPDPLYQLQRYRPRFRNLINASSVVVSKPSPSGESVRFPTRNSRFRNLAFRGSEKLLFLGGGKFL